MSDGPAIPIDSGFRLSQYTIDELESIDGVSPIVRQLSQICCFVAVMPDPTAVGKRKKELRMLLSSLEGLSVALDDLTADTCMDLLGRSKETASPKFRMDDLMRFWQQADIIAGRAIDALANSKPQSGATPKMNARSLALFTAHRFRMQKLPLTNYQDGTYMRVLELLFKELFPSSKKAGYRRHGKWAIEKIGKA